MLPKLQQSSIAQSLRRDNPATLLQSINIFHIQLKINSKLLSINKTINHTSPGKINLPQKTLILLLATSPINASLKIGFKINAISQIMKQQCQDLLANSKNLVEQVEIVLPPFRRKRSLLNLLQNLGPSQRGMFLLQNSEGITIEEICPSE